MGDVAEELKAGIYETLVTEGLRRSLQALDDRWHVEQRGLRAAEAPDRIARHLARQIERALADVATRTACGLASKWRKPC